MFDSSVIITKRLTHTFPEGSHKRSLGLSNCTCLFFTSSLLLIQKKNQPLSFGYFLGCSSIRTYYGLVRLGGCKNPKSFVIKYTVTNNHNKTTIYCQWSMWVCKCLYYTCLYIHRIHPIAKSIMTSYKGNSKCLRTTV